MNRQMKNHYVTMQFGPVQLQRKDRRKIQGILTQILDGVLQNAYDPKEAATFIDYFIRERLDKEDKKMLVNLEIHQRTMTTIGVEQEDSTSMSSIFTARREFLNYME